MTIDPAALSMPPPYASAPLPPSPPGLPLTPDIPSAPLAPLAPYAVLFSTCTAVSVTVPPEFKSPPPSPWT